jgi:NADH-quinone oxidoreductase subunit H
MALGWKVLLPLALAYIMVICVAVYLLERFAGLTDPIYQPLALFGLNLVIAVLVFGVLDRGVFVHGSGRQRRALNARARRGAVTT